MSSEIKIGQYLECCIDLPSINGSAESPVFFWKGNEWLFRSVVKYTTSWSGKWDFEVYLDLKKKHTDLEPCQVKCQIGMKKEEILRSYKFQVSPHYLIWSISLEDLQKKLSSSSQDGNTLNILLFFDGETKPLLKLSKEIENTSSELQLLSSNGSLENLSQDLSKMLHDGLDHDVEIKCDDQIWKVHKNVLGVRSDVLRAMLNSDMVEGRTGVITFQDMDVPTVQHFLNYLYCGKLPEMTTEVAKRFYEIGDKYAVEYLKKVCANFLVMNLTPENACETLMVAIQHSDSSFKESVIQFMIEKRVFMNDNLWPDFCEIQPRIALEVYGRFCKAECSTK